MAVTPAWRNATPEHMFGRVLRPDEFHTRARYASAAPAPELAPWVERYWSVCFDLDDGEAFRTATLDDPGVHLTVERGGVHRTAVPGPGVWVTGPQTARRFDVTLVGSGSTVGVAFAVGGTRAFSSGDPATVVDRSEPGAAWFPGATALGDVAESAVAAAAALDAFLAGLGPRSDPAYERFRAAYAAIDDPDVVRVEDVAARAGCDPRTVQRLFHRFAGVGPKWALRRARVIRAVGSLDRDFPGSLAELAAAHGWFDQAHFTRDFRRVTGETPAGYRARRRPDEPR